MVFYTLLGVEICARIDPGAATGPGEVIPLMANMNHMHIIDTQTDLVL